jgi:hypothetical protein
MADTDVEEEVGLAKVAPKRPPSGRRAVVSPVVVDPILNAVVVAAEPPAPEEVTDTHST